MIHTDRSDRDGWQNGGVLLCESFNDRCPLCGIALNEKGVCPKCGYHKV